ncbi:MAG: hypothetical protein DMG51_20060 [Acidobacteria bacterium]|nr:MAG: hypothetical protein DMG51_20060 [Acidobacteriota bacterium]
MVVAGWAFPHSPDAPSASCCVRLPKPFEWEAPSRIFSGDFHISPRKRAFSQPFLRFFLAFCDYLGYSPLRPEFFR